VPHNLTLIVTGKFSESTSSVLKVVQEQVEPVLVENGSSHGHRPPGWKRPFLETASAKRPLIAQTVKEVVEFPEKDESMFLSLCMSLTKSACEGMGELTICFLGPPPNAFLERKVHILYCSFYNVSNRIIRPWISLACI